MILSAMDLLKGKTVDKKEMYNPHVQPPQMIKDSEKDENWKQWNMDWLEQVGLTQLRGKSKRLTKNYKLAAGVIDKSDYIVGEKNEMSELVDYLTKEDESALEIKFYPIIPPIINVLLGEFSKRSNTPIVRAVDEFSFNEAIDQKYNMLLESLTSKAKSKISGEVSQEQLMSLPEIEQYMRKDYRGLVEEWATHQLAADEERFRMYELESLAFNDALVTGTEFWHIAMRENDYEIEVWNPRFTFCHMSPDVRYVSQGNFAGNIQLMSPSDIVDKFGYLMNEEQIASLETTLPNINRGLIADGREFTDYYDPTIPHDKQVPSQNLWSLKETAIASYKGTLKTDDLLYSLNNTKEDLFERQGFIRVTQAYWKSKQWIALLTSVDEQGNVETDWVDETFVVTEKPVYDNTTSSEDTKENLIYGQHLDPIYINQTWKGIKIGSALSAVYGKASPGFQPIYLDIKPLPFQLKGDFSMYGCRLPVEGCAFSDRNAPLVSFVDLLKPSQIGYNILNNQIADISIDELGSVLILDQNTLPKYSMGEEWGRGNLAKAYLAMRNFSIMPLDHSLDNTDERIQYNQHTVLDLSQTKRLLSRIELARYFKEEAFAVVGITPQRMGEVTASETATGTQQAVNNSYAQTEMYFVKHMNFLMPRVKEAILNTAQYYHSTKESVPLSYINSSDEAEFFKIEGTKLLARDFNVYCTQKPNSRAVLDQLKQLAVQNNTSGASLYDLARIIQSESPTEVASILKASQQRAQQQAAQEQQHEMELQQEAQQHAEQLRQQEMEFEASENQKDRDTKIAEAEIRSSATANLAESDDSGLPFAKQVADEYYRERELSHKQRVQTSKEALDNKKIALDREKMASDERIENTKLKVAKAMHGETEKNKKEIAKSRPKPKS